MYPLLIQNPVLRLLLLAMITSIYMPRELNAQPGKSDVELLRESVLQLQAQLDSLQEPSHDDHSRAVKLGQRTVVETPVITPDKTLVLRYYDLSDLFGVAPHYPAYDPGEFDGQPDAAFPDGARGGLRGFGGTGSYSMPSPRPQDVSPAASLSTSSLTQVIRTVIEPQSWASNEWTLSEIGVGLLINAPESAHQQIEALVKLFRKQWGSLRTIYLEAVWIRADTIAITELMKKARQSGTAMTRGAGVVPEDAWDAFYHEAIDSDRIAYATMISMHNGQTVNASSGARPIFISHIRPEFSQVAEQAPADITHHLELKQIQLGSTLQVTGAVTRGGNYVVLDLHNRINELDPQGSESITGDIPVNDPRAIAAALDRPAYETFQLSTTTRCPNNEITLIGGLAGPDPDSANACLYLFIRPTVHEVILDENRSVE
jgi:hypothetical protein